MNSEPSRNEKNGKAERETPHDADPIPTANSTPSFLQRYPQPADKGVNQQDEDINDDDEDGRDENGDGDEDEKDDGGFQDPDLQDDDGWVQRGVPGVVIYPQATNLTRGSNRALVLAHLVYWLGAIGLRNPRAQARINHDRCWVGTCADIGCQIGLSKQQVWTALQWIKQNITALTIQPYKKTQLQITGNHSALGELRSKQRVFVPAGIVKLCGDANQAILLANFCYWFQLAELRMWTTSIGGKPFIRKTHRRMRTETGLSCHQIKRALLALVRRGYVRRKVRVDHRMCKKLYLAPCVDRLAEEWENAKIEGSYREYLEGMSG